MAYGLDPDTGYPLEEDPEEPEEVETLEAIFNRAFKREEKSEDVEF